jgi:hypothetical protein
MTKFETYVLSATVLGGLFLAGSLVHSRDSQAKAATYSTPVTVMNTTQTPVPNQDVSRAPSNLAMLYTVQGESCPPTNFSILGDGSHSCFDMASHPGQALMLTDVEWAGSGNTPGSSCGVVLNLPSGGGGSQPVVQSWATANSNGDAFKSEHLTTGVKMTANPILFFECTDVRMVLRGYFLPNQ